MMSREQKRKLQQAVLRWYRRHQRQLWWRRQPTPYVVLVAEMMLQQTQVAKVSPKLVQFLRRFPSFADLAAAPLSAVLQMWQGLGYNRRAVYLWRIAREVIERYGGSLPHERQQLQQLPGIGDYTAAAIRVFAFNMRDVVLDTNIKRVLSRAFFTLQFRNEVMPHSQLRALAEEILPPRAYRHWSYALMDLGATVCRAREAQCVRCPVRRWCQSASVINALPIRRRDRQEPTFQGVPRRIWRGRIVEVLRQHSELSIAEILRHLQLALDGETEQWVGRVLQQLCSEGLVAVARHAGMSVYMLGSGR